MACRCVGPPGLLTAGGAALAFVRLKMHHDIISWTKGHFSGRVEPDFT